MADSEKPVPEQDQPPAELATPPPAKQTIEATEAEIEYLHKLRLERQQRQPSPPKKARLPPDEQGWAEFLLFKPKTLRSVTWTLLWYIKGLPKSQILFPQHLPSH